MAAAKIKAAALADLLAAAQGAGYEAYAPAKGPEGWAFARYDGGAVDFDGYLLTTLSAKGFVLPQLETLLRYDGDEGELAATPAETKRLLVGVRPCDARALSLMAKVYAGARGFADPHFAGRREKTTLVVFACDKPAATCFCTSTGGGPGDAAGADVMAYQAGDDYVLAAVSAKGEELWEALQLDDASPEETEKAKTAYAEVAEGMKPLWGLAEVRARLAANFDAAAWEEVAARCLSCGACTFVCPSCHCFDVADEGKRGRGARLRFWDACTQPLFTLHASGHNPRARKSQRYRQRVLHKFYYFHENWGENLCVGCGRCVVACPTNVDIREAVALVAGE